MASNHATDRSAPAAPIGTPHVLGPRERIGSWLMRPYLERLWEHYRRMSDPMVNPAGRRAANNCDYISIGIRYAGEPRPHAEAGVVGRLRSLRSDRG